MKSQSVSVRSWEYLDGGIIVLNGGERTLRVHPNMPLWIVAGNMARAVNRDQGPGKTFVLSLTDRCNIRCDFCCHPYQNSELASGDCLRMVEEACALPFDEICVTGGEPYLRRALVYELAALCRSRGRLFGSITNGYWARDRSNAFRLAHEMVENGVARVTFSWDPSHGAFVNPQAVQNGIDACMEAGMRVTLAGSFKARDDCHRNYGIDVSLYQNYSNFAVVESYIAPAGWGKSLLNLYHAPVSQQEAETFRCPGCYGEELVVYALDGLVQPCCSVHAGYEMPNLRIGDWRKQSVAQLKDAQQGDGFYRVIVDGGFKLLYEILRERAPDVFVRLPDAKSALSSCHLCESIMVSADARRIRQVCDEYVKDRLVGWVRANADYLSGIFAEAEGSLGETTPG